MLRKCFLLAAALAFAPLASAQFGAYATFTAERLSGIQASPLTNGTAYNNTVNPTGGIFGAFYDFKTFGPVRLGADARFLHITDTRGAATFATGQGTHIYSGLGGVRASFHTPIKLLAPYVQASAGYGRSDYGILILSSASSKPQLSNSFAYQVVAGVDYNLLPYVGWRAVEIGYGALSGGSHTYPIASISTGIVIHLGSKN